MSEVPCHNCGGKWLATGGNLCGVCRSVDRLASIIRSNQTPPERYEAVLLKLRVWISDILDLGEVARGVVPDPSFARRAKGGPQPPPPPPEGGAPPGATPKASALAPPPPPPPAVPGTGGRTSEPERKEGEPAASSSSRPTKEKKKDRKDKSRRRSKSPSHRDRKRDRRSRSRRRPKSRSPLPRLASPVRPQGVKSEDERSEDPAKLRARKAAPVSPQRSPPRGRCDRVALPRFAEGRNWSGPIRARPRQPPPGCGKHFNKNKGVTKRKKRAEFKARTRRFNQGADRWRRTRQG